MSSIPPNTPPGKGLRDCDIEPAWAVIKRAEAHGLAFAVENGATLAITFPEPEEQWFALHQEILRHRVMIAKLILVRSHLERH